jgi:hypothetical protein
MKYAKSQETHLEELYNLLKFKVLLATFVLMYSNQRVPHLGFSSCCTSPKGNQKVVWIFQVWVSVFISLDALTVLSCMLAQPVYHPAYEMDYWGITVHFPAWARYCFLLYRIQTGSRVHLAYPICTADYSKNVKQSGYEADHSPLASASVFMTECA